MENPDFSPAKNPPLTTPKPEHAKTPKLIVTLVLVAGIVLASGVYYKGHVNATNAVHQNNSLSTQAATLSNKIKQQNDLNNGVAQEGANYKDPAGQVGLLNGAVTMALPKDWVRIPQSDCSGGSIDSKATCEDVASVAPNSFVKADGTAKWGATIGVFDYSSSDGDAKAWYEGKYFGSPLASFSTPQATNISEAPINGNSGLSLQWVSLPLSNPGYVNDVFTIVHGKYAVVVSAQLQVGSLYGPEAFDYRTTYQPLINQMVQSIKFQD